jgi:hypothetical protein
MGGRIGLATGKYAPDRFSSLIIGGNGLSEKDSEEEMEELQGFWIPLMEQGVDGWMAFLGRKIEDLESWERDKWDNTDFDAMIAYCSYYENIGMAEYLPTLTVPCPRARHFRHSSLAPFNGAHHRLKFRRKKKEYRFRAIALLQVISDPLGIL